MEWIVVGEKFQFGFENFSFWFVLMGGFEDLVIGLMKSFLEALADQDNIRLMTFWRTRPICSNVRGQNQHMVKLGRGYSKDLTYSGVLSLGTKWLRNCKHYTNNK